MIPTRLGAKYKEGTVVGFNSRTGSILVFANSVVVVDHFYHCQFTSVQEESLKSFPEGYKWPTEHDFYSLGVSNELKPSPLFNYTRKLIRPLINFRTKTWFRYFYLVSCSTRLNSENTMLYFQCGVAWEPTETVGCDFFRSSYNNGNLIPVYYINGANCDSD